MTHRLLALFAVAFTLLASASQSDDLYPYRKNTSFKRGEELDFKMTYSIFTVGKGATVISDRYYSMDGRQCFKIDIHGETVGLVSWVSDVDDHFGGFIDTASLMPHQFYRIVREGHYKKDEWTRYDFENKKIEVKTLDNKTGRLKEPKYYEMPEGLRVWDLISGFLYFRTVDFNRVNVGDTLTLKAFFEDTFYNLRVVYKGKDVVKIKPGKFRAVVLKPVMPDNSLFDGPDAITAYFSDDANRIPLRIDAEMFIGSAGVELTDYKNLRNAPSRVSD